ncbi:putative oxidoreductase [Hymenobacter sp. UYAg731]
MSPSVRNIIAWILQALLAAMFIFSGVHKLMDLPGTMKMFGGLGLPGWFAGLIGGAEVLGGLGLLVPRTVRPAAVGLIIIMVGAVFMHATKIPGGLAKGMPAIVALLLLVVVLVLRSRTEARAV